MVFDNSALITARKNVTLYEQLVMREQQCLSRLNELEANQPVLAERLRKEAQERADAVKKARGIGPRAKKSRNELPREIMEEEQAARNYYNAGIEYDNVLNEARKCSEKIREMKNVYTDYHDILVKTIFAAADTETPLGIRVRQSRGECKDAERKFQNLDKLIRSGSFVIKECTNLEENLEKHIGELMSRTFGVSAIAFHAQYWVKGPVGCSVLLDRAMKRFLEAMRKSIYAEWFSQDQLLAGMNGIAAEISYISSGAVTRVEEAVLRLKRIQNYVENTATLMFAITDRMRTEANEAELQSENIRAYHEKLLLTFNPAAPDVLLAYNPKTDYTAEAVRAPELRRPY
ncbi:MAG: hypothetical protein J5845_06200 [Lachnospiraceae bacterium]|nr:hypothetical protein [Lachnospiraceae bacterium]